MTTPAVALDAGLARALGAVLVPLERLLTRTDLLHERLRAWGVDEAAAGALTQHLGAHRADVSALSAALPRIVSQLASASFDGPRLVLDVAAAWRGLDALVRNAPSLPPGAGLAPLNLLDRLLAEVLDEVLRARAPLAWTVGLALGLFGSGRSPFASLGEVLDDPLQFALRRLLAQRRQLDVHLAGLLSGPRSSSLAALALGDGLPVAPPVQAVAPGATRVAQRLALHLAADTYDDAWPVTLDVLVDDASGYRGLALTAGPLVDGPLQLGGRLSVSLTPLNAPMSVVLSGDGRLQAVTAGPPALELSPVLGGGALPSFSIGPADGPHVSLEAPELKLRLADGAWQLKAGFGRFEVVIPRDVGGPVLALLLPAGGVRLAGRMLFVLDGRGLRAEGGVGLQVRSPEVIRLPGLQLSDLVTELGLHPGGLGLKASGTLALKLGPLAVTIEGLGLSLSLDAASPGRDNLGILNLSAPSVTVPTGFGLKVDTPVIAGGGFLRRLDDGGYAGAMELALNLGAASVTVKAFGVFGSIEGAVSFVVVLSVEFSPPIELFLGLTLNGVGGIFGFNRSIDANELGGLVRRGEVDQLLFPDDLIGRAPAIIDSVRRVFPARRDQIVVGPMLKLGWGRPVSFVTATVGVVVTAPDPALIVFIGRLQVVLPEEHLPIVHLQANFAGSIDLSTGNTGFDASLVDSRIGTFSLSGDLALRAGPQGFVFSAGGFHPRFPPPASVGAMRRLTVDLSPGPLLKMWAEAYLAITASSVQFGARAFLRAELGPIEAHGQLGFDALIRLDPLYFSVEISGEFALAVGGTDLLSARLSVLLEGPDRWHARAHASIQILFFEISGTIDLAWGEDSAAPPRPALEPAQEVLRALDTDRAWTVSLPADAAGAVRLREGAEGLHPLGQLRLSQTAVPLGIGLQHIGASPVSSGAPVQLVVTADGAVVAPVHEAFALAQFIDMTDDERLSRPAFVPCEAGVLVSGAGWGAAHAVAGDLHYEESLGDEPRSRFLVGLAESMQGWLAASSSSRALAALGPVAAPPAAMPGLQVTEPRWALASATTGAVLADSRSPTTIVPTARSRRSVDLVVLADHEWAA